MTHHTPFKLATCCIITHDTKTFKSNKDMVIGTVTQKAMLALPPVKQREKLSAKVLHNLTALYKQLSFIALQPVEMRMFRISSGLLPMFDHPELGKLYDDKLLFVVDHWLAKCKQIIDQYDIRVSSHPDQYVVLDSLREDVRLKAIKTLEYHKYFMERLTTPDNGAVINIHLNGKLGRHLPEYDQLVSLGLDKWLSFENSDKGLADHDFTLAMCEKYNIRYVYDMHHHLCKSGEYLPLDSTDFARIQKLRGSVRPKFHVSQSRDNNKVIPAHSDYITDPVLIQYVSDLLSLGDIAVECKAKNLAVQRLLSDITKV